MWCKLLFRSPFYALQYMEKAVHLGGMKCELTDGNAQSDPLWVSGRLQVA